MKIKRYNKGSYRFYDIEGETYPSVTSVLGLLPKPWVIRWSVIKTIQFIKEKNNLSQATTSEAFGFHKKLLSSLAQKGTDIHNLIEDYIKDGKLVDNSALKRYIEFEEEYNFVCDSVEQVVYDYDYYRSAGTLDFVGTLMGEKIFLDLKTSKEIRLSHKIQATAYK